MRPKVRTKPASGASWVLFSLAIFLWPGVPHAEYLKEASLLKAAYIFNFAKFATWPEDTWRNPRSPLMICTAGADGLATSLQRLEGERVRGRPVRILAYPGSQNACHILYLAASENANMANWLDSIRGRPVLTISEQANFSRSGGMIELFRQQDRIRFRINIVALRTADLRLSSRLLDLADILDEGARP